MNDSKLTLIDEPVFISDSFNAPLFNIAMETELNNIINWLKKQPVSFALVENVTHIISELIQINHKLCTEVDFDEYLTKYFFKNEHKVHDDFFTRNEFFIINKEIKIIDFGFGAVKPFFTQHTSHYILYLMRQIQDLIMKIDDCAYYKFLYRFFLELYRANICIKENFHVNQY